MSLSSLLDVAKAMLMRDSHTPDDAGCMDLVMEKLAPLGFVPEWLPFGNVRNVWAVRGKAAPVFCFLGHTDVVPTGPLSEWTHPPFAAHVVDGKLYGRGAADMKGSIAAMMHAFERFLAETPHPSFSLAMLLTSDEEGPSIDGVAKVAELFKARGQTIDWCLVGEPSSEERLGDTIKIGRRGTLTGFLTVIGKQGHVAYPEKAENPIHRVTSFLDALCRESWDRGNDHFPPTRLQISNIHAGTGATNVIPGQLELTFNFRYSPESSVEHLQSRVLALLDAHKLQKHSLRWHHSGQPFLTTQGRLLEACRSAITKTLDITPTLATHGGTSDGRFIAPLGTEVVEFGPMNHSIHQIDEHIGVEELSKVSDVYLEILRELEGK